MWTPMLFYKEFERKVLAHETSHGARHEANTIEQLKIRATLENRSFVSSFTISNDEIEEAMLFAAEDEAERVSEWLNNKGSEADKKQIAIRAELDDSIGIVVNKRNKKFFVGTGSVMLVVLTKHKNPRTNEIWFEITTEYVDLTQEEIKNLKESN